MELITIHPFVKRAFGRIKVQNKNRAELAKLNIPARFTEYRQTHELLKRALKPLAKMMLSVGIKQIEFCEEIGQLNVYFNNKGSYPELFDMRLWPRKSSEATGKNKNDSKSKRSA